MRYKVLQSVLLIMIFFSSFVFAKPPILKNAANSCWSNTALQLLYNIRGLTEELLKKEVREKYKDNDLVTDYINFIDAAKNDPGNVDKFAKKMHATTCNTLFKGVKDVAKPYENNMIPLMERMRDEAAKYFGVKYKDGDISISREYPDYLSDIGSKVFLNKKKKVEIFPPYIFDTESVFDKESSPQFPYFDEHVVGLEQFAIDEIKNNVTVDYDLIGMAVNTGGHWIAYVNDQFEDDPKKQDWYYCNDVGGRVERVDDKNKETPMANSRVLGIYKKVEIKKSVGSVDALDKLAQAFQNITKGK